MSFAKIDNRPYAEHAPAALDEENSVYTVGYDRVEGVQKVATMVWNTTSLAWERAVQATGGSGGTGGDTTGLSTEETLNAVLGAIQSLNANIGFSTEETLATVLATLQSLNSVVTVCNTNAVTLDPDTIAALQNINANVTGEVVVSNFPLNDIPTPDNTMALMSALRALVHPIWEEASSGRLRVVLDPLGGAQTLGTVTSIAQIAGVQANSLIYDQMTTAWACSTRRAVS